MQIPDVLVQLPQATTASSLLATLVPLGCSTSGGPAGQPQAGCVARQAASQTWSAARWLDSTPMSGATPRTARPA